MQASSAPGPSRQPEKKVSPEGDAENEEPDISTLSLAEKMALFNRLSRPPVRTEEAAPAEGCPRRSHARFHTQPITVGEVAQVSSYSIDD